MNPVHVIGDSHVSLFAGADRFDGNGRAVWPDLLPDFRTHYLGAVLAYSIGKAGTKIRGREKLFQVLKGIPEGACILLCCGAIDCETLHVRLPLYPGKTAADVATVCADRYCSLIDEVVLLGYRTMVWAVMPTSGLPIPKPRFPLVGSVRDRNRLREVFNFAVEERCKNCPGLAFVSIWDHLVNADGSPRTEYYGDPAHLSQRALPFARAAVAHATERLM